MLCVSNKERAYVNSKMSKLWALLGNNWGQQSQRASEYGEALGVPAASWRNVGLRKKILCILNVLTTQQSPFSCVVQFSILSKKLFKIEGPIKSGWRRKLRQKREEQRIWHSRKTTSLLCGPFASALSKLNPPYVLGRYKVESAVCVDFLT